MSHRMKRHAAKPDDPGGSVSKRKRRKLSGSEEPDSLTLTPSSGAGGTAGGERLAASWTPRHLGDLKAYNKKTAAEKPGELIRKDLISAMKLPDSEYLSADEYFEIADTWRQEWERGVQVPVNPDRLPQPRVCRHHPAASSASPANNKSGSRDFRMPKKLVRVVHDDQFDCDVHHMSTAAARADKSCRYDLDQHDTSWLSLFNGERARMGLAGISELDMERAIDTMERQCWTRLQQIVRTQDGLSIEYDENVVCDVCQLPDSEEDNEMVFCDKCNICVHQTCYGITSIPDGSWLCKTCSLGIKPDCVLCPNKGGAMKSTRSGHKWAHVSCALWIPEVSIGDVEKMEPITKISNISARRWALVCVLCKEKSGACIQCSVKSCKTAYHVTCAFKHGLKMKPVEDESEEDEIKLKSYCLKHSKDEKLAGDTDSESEAAATPVAGSDALKRTRKQKLQQIESEFYKHVDQREVAAACHLSADTVDFVFNYWKLKRKSQHNKPLLIPAVESTDARSELHQQSLDKVKRIVHIRQNLEKVRNLCYMVNKRQKQLRNYFRLREQTFTCQRAALLAARRSCLAEPQLLAVLNASQCVDNVYDRHYSSGTRLTTAAADGGSGGSTLAQLVDQLTSCAAAAAGTTTTPAAKLSTDGKHALAAPVNGLLRRKTSPGQSLASGVNRQRYVNGTERRQSVATSGSSGAGGSDDSEAELSHKSAAAARAGVRRRPPVTKSDLFGPDSSASGAESPSDGHRSASTSGSRAASKRALTVGSGDVGAVGHTDAKRQRRKRPSDVGRVGGGGAESSSVPTKGELKFMSSSSAAAAALSGSRRTIPAAADDDIPGMLVPARQAMLDANRRLTSAGQKVVADELPSNDPKRGRGGGGGARASNMAASARVPDVSDEGAANENVVRDNRLRRPDKQPFPAGGWTGHNNNNNKNNNTTDSNINNDNKVAVGKPPRTASNTGAASSSGSSSSGSSSSSSCSGSSSGSSSSDSSSSSSGSDGSGSASSSSDGSSSESALGGQESGGRRRHKHRVRQSASGDVSSGATAAAVPAARSQRGRSIERGRRTDVVDVCGAACDGGDAQPATRTREPSGDDRQRRRQEASTAAASAAEAASAQRPAAASGETTALRQRIASRPMPRSRKIALGIVAPSSTPPSSMTQLSAAEVCRSPVDVAPAMPTLLSVDAECSAAATVAVASADTLLGASRPLPGSIDSILLSENQQQQQSDKSDDKTHTQAVANPVRPIDVPCAAAPQRSMFSPVGDESPSVEPVMALSSVPCAVVAETKEESQQETMDLVEKLRQRYARQEPDEASAPVAEPSPARSDSSKWRPISAAAVDSPQSVDAASAADHTHSSGVAVSPAKSVIPHLLRSERKIEPSPPAAVSSLPGKPPPPTSTPFTISSSPTLSSSMSAAESHLLAQTEGGRQSQDTTEFRSCPGSGRHYESPATAVTVGEGCGGETPIQGHDLSVPAVSLAGSSGHDPRPPQQPLQQQQQQPLQQQEHQQHQPMFHHTNMLGVPATNVFGPLNVRTPTSINAAAAAAAVAAAGHYFVPPSADHLMHAAMMVQSWAAAGGDTAGQQALFEQLLLQSHMQYDPQQHAFLSQQLQRKSQQSDEKQASVRNLTGAEVTDQQQQIHDATAELQLRQQQQAAAVKEQQEKECQRQRQQQEEEERARREKEAAAARQRIEAEEQRVRDEIRRREEEARLRHEQEQQRLQALMAEQEAELRRTLLATSAAAVSSANSSAVVVGESVEKAVAAQVASRVSSETCVHSTEQAQAASSVISTTTVTCKTTAPTVATVGDSAAAGNYPAPCSSSSSTAPVNSDLYRQHRLQRQQQQHEEQQQQPAEAAVADVVPSVAALPAAGRPDGAALSTGGNLRYASASAAAAATSVAAVADHHHQASQRGRRARGRRECSVKASEQIHRQQHSADEHDGNEEYERRVPVRRGGGGRGGGRRGARARGRGGVSGASTPRRAPFCPLPQVPNDLSGTVYDFDDSDEFGAVALPPARSSVRASERRVSVDSRSICSSERVTEPDDTEQDTRSSLAVSPLPPPTVPALLPVVDGRSTVGTSAVHLHRRAAGSLSPCVDRLPPMLTHRSSVAVGMSFTNISAASADLGPATFHSQADARVTVGSSGLSLPVDGVSSVASRDQEQPPRLQAENLPVSAAVPAAFCDQRNQLKVKIKGPFMNPGYNSSVVAGGGSAGVGGVDMPPTLVADGEIQQQAAAAAAAHSNLRMRKKELIRQYVNSTETETEPPQLVDMTACSGAVDFDATSVTAAAMTAASGTAAHGGMQRHGFGFPKAVKSANHAPTRADYTPTAATVAGGKRRSRQPMEPISTSAGDQAVGDVKGRSVLEQRPPKKRLESSGAPVLSVLEQIRRDSLQFGDQMLASFGGSDRTAVMNASGGNSIEGGVAQSLRTSPLDDQVVGGHKKSKKKKKHKDKTAEKASKRRRDKLPRPSEVQVVGGDGTAVPKLIIRFGSRAQDSGSAAGGSDNNNNSHNSGDGNCASTADPGHGTISTVSGTCLSASSVAEAAAVDGRDVVNNEDAYCFRDECEDTTDGRSVGGGVALRKDLVVRIEPIADDSRQSADGQTCRLKPLKLKFSRRPAGGAEIIPHSPPAHIAEECHVR